MSLQLKHWNRLVRLGWFKPEPVNVDMMADGFYIQIYPNSYYVENTPPKILSEFCIYFTFDYNWLGYKFTMDWSFNPHDKNGMQINYMMWETFDNDIFYYYFNGIQHLYMELEDYFEDGD